MYRRPFTVHEAYECGITHAALKWGVRQNVWQRIGRGVYLEAGESPTFLEWAIATTLVTEGVACGTLAGLLYGLDSLKLAAPFVAIPTTKSSRRQGVCRRDIAELTIVDGIACTTPLQTLVDLASVIDDAIWEQVLESALRKRLFRLEDLPVDGRTNAASSMRRVLRLRGRSVPPTESLLETLMVQLIRTDARLPAPLRQVEVPQARARVDLAWPEAGVFIELDGMHHKDQPLYDARRETAVVAETGWVPARFTWHEVTATPKQTMRRLAKLYLRGTGNL